jgi:hypothetical protein
MKFVIEVDGVERAGRFEKAKYALATALDFWEADPADRPEVIVRRVDSRRAVYRLPGGMYRRVELGGSVHWQRVRRGGAK